MGGREQREERQGDGSQHLRETRSREPLAEIVSVKWVEKPCFTTWMIPGVPKPSHMRVCIYLLRGSWHSMNMSLGESHFKINLIGSLGTTWSASENWKNRVRLCHIVRERWQLPDGCTMAASNKQRVGLYFKIPSRVLARGPCVRFPELDCTMRHPRGQQTFRLSDRKRNWEKWLKTQESGVIAKQRRK